MNLRAERCNIVNVALSYGVDPELILAIRLAEGDPPLDSLYGEFGMPRKTYTDYQARLYGCCATMRGLIGAYLGNPFEIVTTQANHRRLRYMQAVIEYIGRTYCPTGPGTPDKNARWVPNVSQIYNERTQANVALV